MNIRSADTGDIAGLARLNLQVQQLHLDSEPDFFRMPDSVEVEGFFEEALSDQDKQILVAVEGRSVAGYLLAEVRERPETPFMVSRRWLQLDQIGVDPAFRRRGYGRSLVSEAVSRAREMGITELQTGVWAFNEPSLGLFEAEGFRLADVRLHRSLGAEV